MDDAPHDSDGTRGGPPQPSWLQEPCPSWCARDHAESDLPEDRYHDAEAAVVAVLADTSGRFGPPQWDATTLVLRLGRDLNASRDWIAIETAETPDIRLTLTTESAQVMTAELALLGEVAQRG